VTGELRPRPESYLHRRFIGLPFGIAAAFFLSVPYLKLSPIYGAVASLFIGALLRR